MFLFTATKCYHDCIYWSIMVQIVNVFFGGAEIYLRFLLKIVKEDKNWLRKFVVPHNSRKDTPRVNFESVFK